MIWLIRNIPIPIHLMVLLLCVILRLPCFLGGFFLPGESLYLICAQKIAGAGVLYTDAWFGGPPIMVWIYSLFTTIFGDWALGAIRTFTIVYLYLSTVYFMGMLVEYKVYKRDDWAPAFFLVVLTCTPWFGLELSPVLFMIWPLTYAFHVILQLTVGQKHNFRRLFLCGLILQFCLLAYYPSIGFIPGVLLAYLFFRQPRLDEIFTLLIGFVAGFLIVLLKVYFSSSTMEFFHIVTHWYGGGPGDRETFGFTFSIGAILISWAPFILLAIFGFAHYRLRYFNYVILIRRAERTMTIWLVCGVAGLLLSWGGLQPYDFLFLAPPIAFYAAKGWHFKVKPLMRLTMVVSLIGIPLFFYLNLGAAVFPDTFSFMKKSLEIPYFKGSAIVKEKNLKTFFATKDPKATLWILDDRPGLYPFLDRTCATRYVDFRVVKQKFSHILTQTEFKKGKEPDREIFNQFNQDPPGYILDRNDTFNNLKTHFPTLFSGYTSQKVGDYMIWSK